MKKFEKPFEEYFKESFSEFVSDIYVELRETDKGYQKLKNRKEMILNEYQNLRSVFDEKHSIALSQEEVKALIQLLDIDETMKLKQERALYMRALRESHHLLRKIMK